MQTIHTEPIAIILLGISMFVIGTLGVMGWVTPNQLVMGLLLSLLIIVAFLAGRQSADLW